jgi:hypothetical protein
MTTSLRYIFIMVTLAALVFGASISAFATERLHDSPLGTILNDEIVLPAGGERSTNQAPFTPVLRTPPVCVDVLGDLCVFVDGPTPADPDNNPVTYEYEWWVRNPSTGGLYYRDYDVYPATGNHTLHCVPMADLHVTDEWRVKVKAVDPSGLHSPTASVDFPMLQTNCSCTEYVPDGILLGVGYCITLNDNFYTIEVAEGNGQIPVVYVTPGCSITDHCTNHDCTAGDTSLLSIQCFVDHIELNYTGTCGCFCLYFDHWLPVELTNFDAHVDGDNILLNWSTMSETNHDHFILERSVNDGAWQKVTEIRALGNAVSGHNYAYRDMPGVNGTYRYRLSGVSISGAMESYPQSPSVTYARAVVVPYEFNLEQNFPNPFNPETTIRYSLSEGSNVTLNLYSVDGRLITTLASGYQNAGSYNLTFNGASLPSGVYVYRLTTGHDTAIRKMMLLK